jgi:NAD(P)-dependent dehydrogenase (short-subunit alcohol dehydrogenase family)
MRLEKRTAIVTGGAQGIGAATARRLAHEGANVVIVDVDERGEGVAHALDAGGQPARFVHCDLADADAVAAAMQTASGAFGGVDVLVNNAAITLPKGFAETTPAEWDAVQAVNLRSAYLTMRALAPQLKAAGSGSVVNVASFHAAATIEGFSAYAAAKTGLIGLTRSAALDLAGDGVRVNAVCPGIIDTRMWQAWLDEAADREALTTDVLRFQPLGRIGTPEDVANVIVFLASDEAAYVTGTSLYVDGGVTARLLHVYGE